MSQQPEGDGAPRQLDGLIIVGDFPTPCLLLMSQSMEELCEKSVSPE